MEVRSTTAYYEPPASYKALSIKVMTVHRRPFTIIYSHMKKLLLSTIALLLAVGSSSALGYPRVQVIEEATGTWCQWCPRTIVGCEQLAEKYGSSVIVLAVHSEDSYATSAYAPLIARCSSGLPSAFINRSLSIGTYPEQIETAYLAYANMGEAEGEAKIVEATYADEQHKAVRIRVETRFAKTQQAANYRLAFAVVEDSIYARQANGYAGGSTEMGGFEKKGSNPYIYHNNVVRHIDYYGIEGSVPTSVKAGETYTYEHTLSLPTVKNRKHMSIVALLQNADATAIYNADRTRSIGEFPTTDAVHQVANAAHQSQRGGSAKRLQGASVVVGGAYDLQGRRIQYQPQNQY